MKPTDPVQPADAWLELEEWLRVNAESYSAVVEVVAKDTVGGCAAV